MTIKECREIIQDVLKGDNNAKKWGDWYNIQSPVFHEEFNKAVEEYLDEHVYIEEQEDDILYNETEDTVQEQPRDNLHGQCGTGSRLF